MPRIPRDNRLDATLALFNDPYRFSAHHLSFGESASMIRHSAMVPHPH